MQTTNSCKPQNTVILFSSLTCQGMQGRLECPLPSVPLLQKSVFIVFSLPDANLILAPLRVTHLPLQAAFRILLLDSEMSLGLVTCFKVSLTRTRSIS